MCVYVLTRVAHFLGGEVGVAPRAVPVTGHGLGVEGDHYAEGLCVCVCVYVCV